MSSNIAIEILAYKNINDRNWYLCKGNLLEYLSNLKKDFYEFAIQRRIVKNQYLDSLYNTIKSGDPIPVLTLTFSGASLPNKSGTSELNMSNVEILDGLQRTFRLWAYKTLSEKYSGEKDKEIVSFARKLKDMNPLLFESGVINTSLIRKMVADNEILNIANAFESFDIYFIVWAGLTEKEVVQKMLVLNAGQKAVSTTHQFELLFLHFFDQIKKSNIEIKLFREKDNLASEIKNGRRKPGYFMFSSFIVGLQSFVEQKPLRVSTEDPIGIGSEEESDPILYDLVFNIEYLNVFISLLVSLDNTIFEKEGTPGLEWFVKETTLAGVLAAVGSSIKFREIRTAAELKDQSIEAFAKLEKAVRTKGFKVEIYRMEFANISSRAINFGTFIRKTTMEYTTTLLSNELPDWHDLFIKTQGGK
jgi:hypothetical protein